MAWTCALFPSGRRKLSCSPGSTGGRARLTSRPLPAWTKPRSRRPSDAWRRSAPSATRARRRRRRRRRKQHPPVPPGRRLARPIIEATEVHTAEWSHPAAALYDPSELDEDVDLDVPRKRMILDRFYRLDSANHYEVLGVEPTAEKKEIKDAYFKAVSVLHPDRYFGKNLGGFKTKLDRLFQHLTEAHDVLTRKKSREEYDEYLSTQAKNRDMEQLSGRRALPRRGARAHSPPNRGGSSHRRARHPHSGRHSVSTHRRLAAAGPGSSPPGTGAQVARLDAAGAAQLGTARQRSDGGQGAGRRGSPPSLRATPGHCSRASRSSATSTPPMQAMAEKNVVSAANALRIATSLAPDDQALTARLDEVQQRANQELADSYLDQAKYEERSGRPLEAAASYERAARGKPTASVYERAAACLLEGEGDLRRAAELAKKSVELAPKAPEPRATLAKIYVNAGMKESALLEFERASQLAPDDDSIKDWIKRLKRGRGLRPEPPARERNGRKVTHGARHRNRPRHDQLLRGRDGRRHAGRDTRTAAATRRRPASSR